VCEYRGPHCKFAYPSHLALKTCMLYVHVDFITYFITVALRQPLPIWALHYTLHEIRVLSMLIHNDTASNLVKRGVGDGLRFFFFRSCVPHISVLSWLVHHDTANNLVDKGVGDCLTLFFEIMNHMHNELQHFYLYIMRSCDTMRLVISPVNTLKISPIQYSMLHFLIPQALLHLPVHY